MRFAREDSIFSKFHLIKSGKYLDNIAINFFFQDFLGWAPIQLFTQKQKAKQNILPDMRQRCNLCQVCSVSLGTDPHLANHNPEI